MLHKIEYFPGFLEKRRKEAELKKQQKQQQTSTQLTQTTRQIASLPLCPPSHKTVTNDDIVTHGKILQVKAPTLIDTEFRVVCLYAGEETEVIASREQIIQKNIGALLDYYQNLLNLKDKIVIVPN